jgi:hypothetical protein
MGMPELEIYSMIGAERFRPGHHNGNHVDAQKGGVLRQIEVMEQLVGKRMYRGLFLHVRQHLLRSSKSRSIDQVDNLQTLREILLALEAAAQGKIVKQ